MKKIQNQRGFSAIEVLLLLVILGIIVSMLWYVWRANDQANKNLSSADSSANSIVGQKKAKQSTTNPSSTSKINPASPAPAPAKTVSDNPNIVTTTPTVVNNYITINDWKIKFKHSGSITIMYAHDANDNNNRAVFFGSTQLAAKNKACKAEFYPAGYITRFKVNEHVLDSNGSDTGKAAAEYAGSLTNKDYKQVGDYYYFYHGPKGKCADLKEVEDLQNQTADAVKAFLTSLEAAQ